MRKQCKLQSIQQLQLTPQLLLEALNRVISLLFNTNKFCANIKHTRRLSREATHVVQATPTSYCNSAQSCSSNQIKNQPIRQSCHPPRRTSSVPDISSQRQQQQLRTSSVPDISSQRQQQQLRTSVMALTMAMAASCRHQNLRYNSSHSEF